MRLTVAMILGARFFLVNAAEPGAITGLVHCDGAGANVVVWAVRTDCRVSYRTTDFDQNRYVLQSIPPGVYTLIGSCDGGRGSPTPEFVVNPGRTVEKDVRMTMLTDENGNFAPGLSPMSGRIVDSKGFPIAAATVTVGAADPPGESASDSDGRFGFCAIAEGKRVLTIKHPGYRTRRVSVLVGPLSHSDGQIEIRLRKR